MYKLVLENTTVNLKTIKMKQPELGKMIAELRKVKGYTQEELVEKCKLNVRTLQRIEAGEVIPRSYTVKIILEELDFDFSNSSDFSPEVRSDEERIGLSSILKKSLNFFTNRLTIAILFFIIGGILIYFLFIPKYQDKEVVKKQIELNNEKYAHFYNNYDIDSVLTFYDKWSNFKFAPSTASIDPDFPDFRGQHRIKGLYTNWKSMGKTIVKRQSRNMVINDSLAIDIGLIVFKYEINNREAYSGAHYFAQWHLKKGKWRIENEIMYFPGD